MSNQMIRRLVEAKGTVRVFQMEDGSIVERSGGSVSWRNNNPGNLKFEYSGSADKTVRTNRTKDMALLNAQQRYKGVVDLDQWGNAVFQSYEAGRTAKIQLLRRAHGDRIIEKMLESYSREDYSGAVNHRTQADFIYSEGERQGVELRNKVIGDMTDAEVAALADGIKGFEGWRVGETHVLAAEYDLTRPISQITTSRDGELKQDARGPAVGELQTHLRNLGYTDAQGLPLATDNDFGRNTRQAVEAFQHDHGLSVDGVAGPKTWNALRDATRAASIAEFSTTFPQIAPPDLDAATITTLQKQLQTLGMSDHRGQPLPVTGIYDDVTRVTVMMFQKEQGLPGTGAPDPATRALIEARATIAELRQIERERPAPIQDVSRREDVRMPAVAANVAAYPNDAANPHRTGQTAISGPGLDDPRNALNPHHALYNELHRRIPEASEKRLLQFTAACHSHDINVDNLAKIYFDRQNGTMAFSTSWPPIPSAVVDLKVPSPEPQQSIQNIHQYDQWHAQMMSDIRTQRAQVEAQAQQGPMLGGPIR